MAKHYGGSKTLRQRSLKHLVFLGKLTGNLHKQRITTVIVNCYAVVFLVQQGPIFQKSRFFAALHYGYRAWSFLSKTCTPPVSSNRAGKPEGSLWESPYPEKSAELTKGAFKEGPSNFTLAVPALVKPTATSSGKSKWRLCKWGLNVLVHNCPRLPACVTICEESSP